MRALLGFSWFAFLGHVAGKVVFSADVIVIGAILGARQVALYGVAARLFGLAAGVASTGTDLLLPLQSELEGRGEHERQRSFVAMGVRASTCVAVLLGFPLDRPSVMDSHRMARRGIRRRASHHSHCSGWRSPSPRRTASSRSTSSRAAGRRFSPLPSRVSQLRTWS